ALPPARLGAAPRRDAPASAALPDLPRIDLVAARLVGDVRQPATVGREGDAALFERRAQQRPGRLWAVEGRDPDVAMRLGMVLAEHHRALVRRELNLPHGLRADQQGFGHPASICRDAKQTLACDRAQLPHERDAPTVARPLRERVYGIL